MNQEVELSQREKLIQSRADVMEAALEALPAEIKPDVVEISPVKKIHDTPLLTIADGPRAVKALMMKFTEENPDVHPALIVAELVGSGAVTDDRVIDRLFRDGIRSRRDASREMRLNEQRTGGAQKPN